MNVLDIFYENIVQEARSGRINCFAYYNIAFSTIIEGEKFEYQSESDNDRLLVPSLIINDKKRFDFLLTKYVDLAMKFYDDNNFEKEIIDYRLYDNESKICKEKVILALLFANATYEDFNNPCDFLSKRINFICNDISGNYRLGYCDSFKGHLIIDIQKDIINNETPYQMIISIESSDEESFVFPRIKLGISDEVAYIYAIQNKQNENNLFCKKINRIMYKVGEGYNAVYDNNMEDLKDVTASFLVALNICLSYLYNNGYNKVVVPSFMVERWNAKSIFNSIKSEFKKLNEEESQKLFDSQDYLQYNLTNKLVRTILRLGCHFNNIDVLSFPYEVDSCLHIFINDNLIQCNNSLLYETYKLVEGGIRRKNSRT